MNYRIDEIDALKGMAILGVVLFHLVWDLEFVGFVAGLAFHPIWLGFGRILAGTFMLVVGINLVLAHPNHLNLIAYIKRISILLIAAFAISLLTLITFPTSFIYFGILHSITVSSLVGLAFLRLSMHITLIAGVIVFLLPFYYSTSAFDSRWFAWIGFSESPPASNDFFPVFPWLGLTLIGMAITKFCLVQENISQWCILPKNNACVQSIVWLGKRSLLIYLIHQPVLLAIIIPLSML
ncbi:heparan-alpha-glucosaminide N-acetyltransferase [Coralliovum pocilloporae]|uniref:heparan-alpha-glucosaminide N-acetyltransferase n=1 Tax=Coralliovum pocilloporae TaxID=3066369 RepID=UPI003306A92D